MILPLLPWPADALLKHSDPVREFDAHLKELCGHLADTANGIAKGGHVSLSAIQIGARVRVFYVSAALMGTGEGAIFVNPVMLSHGTMLQVIKEQCLSLPGVEIAVQRYSSVRVEARKVNGDVFVVPAAGTLAQALQHELNHLDGKTIAECCNRVKRKFLMDQQRRFGAHRGDLLNYGVAPIQAA